MDEFEYVRLWIPPVGNLDLVCNFPNTLLKPGGVALISDYKRTGEYADEFRKAGLIVEKKRGSLITTFPPLTVVIARKQM